ncbi:MAG: hypothetical protein R2883_00575 [Caldisericia bacterium]
MLFFDFELDENDNPHITWFRTTVEDGPYLTYGVFSLYTKWNGEEWVNINNKPYNPDQVDCPSGLGEWTARGISFELDGEGKLHFTWEDFSDNEYSLKMGWQKLGKCIQKQLKRHQMC